MVFDFKSGDFRSQLKDCSDTIAKRASASVLNTTKFQQILALLKSLAMKYCANDFHCITITAEEFELIPESDTLDESVKNLLKENTFIDNYHVEINHDFAIINADNVKEDLSNNVTRKVYTELSCKGIYIFLITSSHLVNYFVDGIDGGDSVFYTQLEEELYYKKKKANELPEVLETYRTELNQTDTYQNFFIDHTLMSVLYESVKEEEETFKQFKSKHQHTLYNKPEARFRDNLMFFLKRQMQATILREDLQDDDTRTDISVLDSYGTDRYFIEVKWLGDSISSDGKGFGISFKPTPSVMQKWVNQTVGYICQMHQTGNVIKRGYLVVFDARKDDSTDDSGKIISETMLTDDLKVFYHRFTKIKDFRVKNSTPR